MLVESGGFVESLIDGLLDSGVFGGFFVGFLGGGFQVGGAGLELAGVRLGQGLANLVLLVNYCGAILNVLDVRAFDDRLEPCVLDFNTAVDINLLCDFLRGLFCTLLEGKR